MVENGASEAHKALLASLERLKTEEEKKNKGKKKKLVMRSEKRLQYYSGWTPKAPKV